MRHGCGSGDTRVQVMDGGVYTGVLGIIALVIIGLQLCGWVEIL